MPFVNSVRTSETPSELLWTVRLSDAAPNRRFVILLVAFAAAALGWFGFGRPLWGILGFAMVLGSTAEYWLGSRFRLDAKGAQARTGLSVSAMEWKDVRRIVVEGREVRLSPLEIPSTLEVFRGVALVTTPDNHDGVMSFIEAHVPEAPLQ